MEVSFERATTIGPVAQIMHAAIDLGIGQGAYQDMLRFVRERARPWIDSRVDPAAEAKILSTRVGLLACNKLFELSGTSATLAEDNLDRHWRNVRTHTLHDPVRWKYQAVGNYYLNGKLPPRHGAI
ncbi:MAG: FMNH2-dependent monooxygenase protein [Rhizobium sp.]|nr:FMNH2-dependent monooxygenase protein [Rhizobium sp.]